MMADATATQILTRLGQLQARRSSFEEQWNSIDEYVAGAARFGRETTPGEKRGLKMFESAPIIAVNRLAAALSSLMTPQNEQWHRLEMEDEEDHASKVYADEITRRLFKARYATTSGFSTQAPEWYKSLARYGTAVMMIMDNTGIKYRNLSLATVYLDENFQGEIDTVYRRYSLDGRQAIQQFGDRTPEKIRESVEANKDDKFWFIQCVAPNSARDPGRRDPAGMAFKSTDICEDTKDVVAEGGYRSFPFAVARFSVSDGDIYAYSPLMEILPTVKLANAMKKTTLRAGHMATDSPLLTSNDGALQPFQMVPGALIRGGMVDGKQNVAPLYTGKNVPFSLELMDRERRTINDAMFVSLFEILAEDRRQMTAQEVLQRAQEKGQLLGPVASGIEPALGMMIEREMDILAAAGALPETPESVRAAGGYYRVRYTSPITRAQKAGEGVAVMRMIESTAAIAQFDPTAPKRVKWDVALQVLADAQGLPSKVLRSDDEMRDIEEQDAQAMQTQQLLQAVPVAAQSAKYLAEAQALSTTPEGGSF